MRIIKLCSGSGNGVDSACLMTASNMLIGRGMDGDKNSCVCPVIRKFIIHTNDAMPNEIRSRLYTPLIWEILGTKNDAVIVDRVLLFVNRACEKLLPGLTSPIIDSGSATAACNKIYYGEHYSFQQRLSYACAYAAKTITYVGDQIFAGNAMSQVARAIEIAAYEDSSIWELCPELIREAAAIGEKQKIEFAITVDELAEMLE